ncbi:dihydroxyacetone kinase 1-like protein [Trypanosoma conorhini]|uniref:Dihydroxyacetone kinase 1-like protein n=1 Tax=Trypanosoma conorhini TaxID=83891 RepID=A0A3R7N7C3_9TRYP|nr:dihydroxyacetone kinase 1-like protein [Trypanosoma conorhini]RNF26626.1 dihydroxyacetone kinase 1-like protein [Trypanosoma conorhini]
MVTKKFIDNPDTAVDTAVTALCTARPDLQVIENTHVVVKREIDPTKVLLISGGGAGHEPAHVGFVDSGWLSAAVSGDVFASPPSIHVTAAIDYLHGKQGPNGPGILVVVKNYLGDILNFQFAVHEAQERGINVEMVMAADDACFGVHDVTRRRGIAGTILLYKILGASAVRGADMAALKQLAGRISSGMRSIGASLSSCSLPGSEPLSVVPDGFVEVGLGIHGEKGLYQMPFKGAKALVSHLLGILLAGGEKRDTHAQGDTSKDWAGAKVALLVNNLGSTTDIEMKILARYALEQLREAGMNVVGVSVGRYMTALEMHGFSFTLLRFSNHDDIAFLFEQQQASLMPFTVPQFSLVPAPGPRTALQLARQEQCGTQCRGDLGRALEAVFQVLKGSEEYLNKLDAAVGDGDIGSGTKRAALGALELIPHLPLQTNVGKSFALLAKMVADAFGGSSGPLYGAFLLAAGAAASETMRVDGASSVDAIRAGLRAGSANIQRIARSKKGERTMVDVLEALNESPRVNAATSVQELARACAEVAKRAAAETALLPAKHGRSRYLQGKEVGQQDPGAELVVLWVEAAASALLPRGNL